MLLIHELSFKQYYFLMLSLSICGYPGIKMTSLLLKFIDFLKFVIKQKSYYHHKFCYCCINIRCLSSFVFFRKINIKKLMLYNNSKIYHDNSNILKQIKNLRNSKMRQLQIKLGHFSFIDFETIKLK